MLQVHKGGRGIETGPPPFESSSVMEVFAVRVNTTFLENHNQSLHRDHQWWQTPTEAFQDQGQLTPTSGSFH